MGSSSPESERTLSDRIALHVVEPAPAAASIAVILCCADADADALRADLRALLTEEQRKKLDSFTEGRGPFFIQRFGHTGSVDPAHMPRGVAGVRELRI